MTGNSKRPRARRNNRPFAPPEMTRGTEGDDAGRRPAPRRLLEKAGENFHIRASRHRQPVPPHGRQVRVVGCSVRTGNARTLCPKRFFARTLLKESGRPPSCGAPPRTLPPFRKGGRKLSYKGIKRTGSRYRRMRAGTGCRLFCQDRECANPLSKKVLCPARFLKKAGSPRPKAPVRVRTAERRCCNGTATRISRADNRTCRIR